jgi:hypothetical protein
MSRGPGHVEHAILAIVDELEANPALAGVLQLTVKAWAANVYRVDIIERVTRAQYTATLRAMHALARKYPHGFVQGGRQGSVSSAVSGEAAAHEEKVIPWAAATLGLSTDGAGVLSDPPWCVKPSPRQGHAVVSASRSEPEPQRRPPVRYFDPVGISGATFFLVVRVLALSRLKATWVPSGECLAHISRIPAQ